MMYKYALCSVVLVALALVAGCGGGGGAGGGSQGMPMFTPSTTDMSLSARQTQDAQAATLSDAGTINPNNGLADFNQYLPNPITDVFDQVLNYVGADAASVKTKTTNTSLWMARQVEKLAHLKFSEISAKDTFNWTDPDTGIVWTGTINNGASSFNMNLVGTLAPDTKIILTGGGSGGATSAQLTIKAQGTLGMSGYNTWAGYVTAETRESFNVTVSGAIATNSVAINCSGTTSIESKNNGAWTNHGKTALSESINVNVNGSTPQATMNYDVTSSMQVGAGLFWQEAKGNGAMDFDSAGNLVDIVLTQTMTSSDGYTATFAIARSGAVSGALKDETGTVVATFSGNILQDTAVVKWTAGGTTPINFNI